MILIDAQNANANNISVTGTAATLFALMDTAGGDRSANYVASKGAGVVIFIPEDGDVRMGIGITPTSTKGLLLKEGTSYLLSIGDLEKAKFIRTGGSNVKCSVQLAIGNDKTSFFGGGSGSGSSSSSSSATGGGDNTYYAKPSGTNADATSAYASGTTLTVIGLPFTFTKYDIESIEQVPATGDATKFSEVGDFSVSGTTITVNGGTFAGTDKFIVTFTGPDKGYTKATDTNREFLTNPDREAYVSSSLVDTTNLSAATHDYEFSMDGYTDFTISGQLIDADGTMTLKLYARNSTTGTYVQVYGKDDNQNATSNSWGGTNTTTPIALSFNSGIYTQWKAELVCSGATNTAELLLKRKY